LEVPTNLSFCNQLDSPSPRHTHFQTQCLDYFEPMRWPGVQIWEKGPPFLPLVSTHKVRIWQHQTSASH
jgi:hypothetical protein